MARGKQANRSNASARNNRNLQKQKQDLSSSRKCNDNENVTITRASIDHHWNLVSFSTLKLRSFLTMFPENVTIRSLIQFWSLPTNSPFAGRAAGVSISNVLLILARLYLKLGETHITHALIRCSAFLVQLKIVPMAEMVALSSTDLANPTKLTHYMFASKACIEGREMNYLRDILPDIEASSSSVPSTSMQYVNLVADDWDKGCSSKKHRNSDQDEDSTSTKIKVIISNEDDSVDIEKTISVSAPLKTLFSDYADECGESLRSFRFSFNGSLLFLSAVGKKTAKDLGILDGGVIQVSNVKGKSTALKENDPPEPDATSPAKVKKGRKRKEKKRSSVQTKKGCQSSVIFNLETDRQRHSKEMTRVLDEMELQLKGIRQNINESMLLCQKSKTRRPSSRKSLNASSSAVFNPSMMNGIGGKAGRSSFSVNVGRVENLYKSSKRVRLNHASRASHRVAKIDLHGCTQEEAVERLNEWEGSTMDAAMKGEYPFVVPAVIVCGGGTQILSELVENWIREKRNVANAF